MGLFTKSKRIRIHFNSGEDVHLDYSEKNIKWIREIYEGQFKATYLIDDKLFINCRNISFMQIIEE